MATSPASPETLPILPILPMIPQPLNHRLNLLEKIMMHIEKNKEKIDFTILLNSGNYFSKLIKPDQPLLAEINRILNGNSRKACRIFMNLMNIKAEDLEPEERKKFVSIGIINVLGCPESTDIDVVAVVSRREEVKMVPNEAELRAKLDSMGYDSKRKIDLNLVYLEDNNIQESTHGGKEIQNIILATYGHHKQMYPCIVSKPIEVNIEDKIRIVAKYIFDKLEILLGGKTAYLAERPNKQKLYRQGGWERIDYIIEVLKNKLRILPEDPTWKDVMKSLTMKLIQTLLLDNGELEYTKTGLATKFDNLFPGQGKHALWLLMRGRRGIYDMNCYNILVNEFVRIVQECKVALEWKQMDIEFKNPTTLPDEIFDEFVKSPLIASSKLVDYFVKFSPERSIGKMFVMKCSNIEKLPKDILDKIILVDQRSEEWLKLLTFYKCGKNTGLIPYSGPDWVQFYFNLIRGCFVEQMASNIDFSKLGIHFLNVEKVMIGLCVEEKKENSPGAAPDLLLVVNDDVIPVEIKCIVGFPEKGHSFRRAVKLASLQLKSTCKIINKGNRGIILIIYIYNDDKGKPIFDPRAALIEF